MIGTRCLSIRRDLRNPFADARVYGLVAWRFANRVPLQYQQSGCAITKATMGTDWRNYTLQQGKGALPVGPMVLFVHMASVWVPFTSESKEAIASYPEIIRELRLGLQECGRKLGSFLRRRRREADAEKKKSYIRAYIPHIGIALKEILDLSEQQKTKIIHVLTDTLEWIVEYYEKRGEDEDEERAAEYQAELEKEKKRRKGVSP